MRRSAVTSLLTVAVLALTASAARAQLTVANLSPWLSGQVALQARSTARTPSTTATFLYAPAGSSSWQTACTATVSAKLYTCQWAVGQLPDGGYQVQAQNASDGTSAAVAGTVAGTAPSGRLSGVADGQTARGTLAIAVAPRGTAPVSADLVPAWSLSGLAAGQAPGGWTLDATSASIRNFGVSAGWQQDASGAVRFTAQGTAAAGAAWATSPVVSVHAGQPYTASALIDVTRLSTGASAHVELAFYDGRGTELASADGGALAALGVGPATVGAAAPAGAVTAVVRVVLGTGSSSSGVADVTFSQPDVEAAGGLGPSDPNPNVTLQYEPPGSASWQNAGGPCTTTAAGYQCSLDTGAMATGATAVRIRMTDAAGNVGYSQTVTPDMERPLVGLDQASYTVSESAGEVTVTIVRADPTGSEWIWYGVAPEDARDGVDFDAIPNTQIRMQDGQATFSFDVHVHDLGVDGPPVHANVYLFGSLPDELSQQTSEDITILHDDPLQPRNNANPLGLSPAPTDGNVLKGAPFYVAGPLSPAGTAAAQYRSSNPAWANALSVIADAPGAYRFYYWNTPADPAGIVARYLEDTQVRQPGSVVQLSTYSLVHGQCKQPFTDTPAFVGSYLRWIDGLARGIGNFHVVLFFELDSLITAPCLPAAGLQVRLAQELRPAIQRLERDPHLVLYLDAGAADAVGWQRTASMLRQAGVTLAQGFFVNATHFDWTTRELYYGQQIARALGGVHFVVNTGENGRGPLVPKDRTHHGNEVLCNPPGRGLGPLSTDTGYRWADAFLWFSNPGGSGGPCRPGAPPTAQYWPAYAVMLAQNWVTRVTGPSYPLLRADDRAHPATAGRTHRPKKKHRRRRRHHRAHRGASARRHRRS